MNQNAKQFLTRISEKVSTLTDKPISQVAHAPKENEWRAYIWQRTPWEDIAWRVKEPNANGDAEVHLGFYSSKPGEGFSEGLDNAEQLAKGKVSHIVKNENGIRFVLKVNLNDTKSLKKVEGTILELLPEFIPLALSCVVKMQKENQAATVVDDNLSTSWSYTPAQSKEEFLSWLSSYEMPFEDFDYVAQYKAIYSNRDDLFWGNLDGWDREFEMLLQEKGGVLGNYLLSQISEEEQDTLYNDFDWDKDWQGVLHQRIENTAWGREMGGAPVSAYFIDGWENKEQERLVFELFIESNKNYFVNQMDINNNSSDDYLNFINQSKDFTVPEKYKRFISGEYFTEFMKWNIYFIYFSFTNGSESIENNNGSDYFELVFDIENQCALPISEKYFSEEYLNDPEYRFKMYTNSWHAAMDEFHHEHKEFSSWVEFSRVGSDWSVVLEDVDYRFKGEMAEGLAEIIEQNINSGILYHFLSEVLSELE